MTPCQPLQLLDGMTGADVLRNITANAAIYWECKDSKDALIKAVQDNK
jgi:hypothetical protein